MINYSPRYSKIMTSGQEILDRVAKGKIQSASILLLGKEGTGKTSIACKLAHDSGFPFIKMINAEDLIGKPEIYKVNFIVKCFDDAFKSPRSLIILDDLERIVEYVESGRRFNNNVLQCLLVHIKKLPPKKENSICVLATSANADFLKGKSLLKIILKFTILIFFLLLEYKRNLTKLFI